MAGGVTVLLPKSLRQFWQGPDSVEVDGGTLREVLLRVGERHPGLAHRILDDQGRVRRYVLVFVNREPLGERDPASYAVRGGDTVHILPSVAGGAHARGDAAERAGA